MIKAIFGIAALLPMISSPLPREQNALIVSLCGGGEISIPLGDKNDEPDRACDMQACHAGTCRSKAKKSDLI